MVVVFKEKKYENCSSSKLSVGRDMGKVVLAQRNKKKAHFLGKWGKGVHFSPSPQFFRSILPPPPTVVTVTELSELRILFFISYRHPWRKYFISLIFQMREKRDSERLSDLSKATQLIDVRAKYQIQAYLFLLHVISFPTRCVWDRILKVGNVCYSCLSFKHPLNNFHDDTFLCL